MYSVVIKNAQIIDGDGSTSAVSDIGIQDEKIKTIGPITNTQGAEVIDASGLIAAPGFIDITSHSDVYWTILSSPLQESLLLQGVTTILGGSDGFSLAPLITPRYLPSIQKWTNISKFNVNWSTVGEFLDEIGRRKIGVNFSMLVGYNSLRRQIVRDVSQPATPDEIQKMQNLLMQSMREGAGGLSLSLMLFHAKDSSEEEILAMLQIVKAFKGICKIHLRDEGKNLLPAVSEALRLSRLSGVPFVISHLKALGRVSWGQLSKAIKMIEAARAEGTSVTYDVFPYLRTGSSLYTLLPSWMRSGSSEEILERLNDKKQKLKLIESIQQLTLHWDKIIISSAPDTSIVGKTISEVANNTGISPEEAMINILVINKLHVDIFNKTIHPKQLLGLLKRSGNFIASDGAGFNKNIIHEGVFPHPRSFGAFARFLELARDKKILSPEIAIQKITSGPASFLGLKKRGFIKKGYWADIVLFDWKSVGSRADYRNPALYADGVHYVLVNGHIAVRNGVIVEGYGKIIKKK